MKRHKSAIFAQWRYGHTYETGTSPNEIFEDLDPYQKQCCRIAVNDILAAPDENVPETDTGGAPGSKPDCTKCKYFGGMTPYFMAPELTVCPDDTPCIGDVTDQIPMKIVMYKVVFWRTNERGKMQKNHGRFRDAK